MKQFLTAHWRDLLMINYEVDPTLLEARLPHGVELDLENGRCFVSLIGFMFLDTRVLGMPIPFHRNFEEVNLRFYVKRVLPTETRRGVVFIKELVPRRAIAAVAKVFYGEPYEYRDMSNVRENGRAEYHWASRGRGGMNRIAVSTGPSLGIPAAGSHEEFIIEHYWGYTARGRSRTDEYKVEHPKWELLKTEDVEVDVDFVKTYGPQFGFLKDAVPYSALFALGSEVTVFKGSRII